MWLNLMQRSMIGKVRLGLAKPDKLSQGSWHKMSNTDVKNVFVVFAFGSLKHLNLCFTYLYSAVNHV